MGIIYTDLCWIDIEIDEKPIGRIDIGLYGEVVGKTAMNFKHLAIGDMGYAAGTREPLHYKGKRFHRIHQKFMMQGGDVTKDNGQGGQTSLGTLTMKDAGVHVPHIRRGMVAMANSGKNSNKSQFYITFKNTNWLDVSNDVFG